MLRVPETVPAFAGVNVTFIVQFAPAFRDAPQLLVSEYPVLAAIPEMLRAIPPEFVTVILCGELVVLTSWLEKVRLAGEGVAVGACGN